jgi:hypothetical protein
MQRSFRPRWSRKDSYSSVRTGQDNTSRKYSKCHRIWLSQYIEIIRMCNGVCMRHQARPKLLSTKRTNHLVNSSHDSRSSSNSVVIRDICRYSHPPQPHRPCSAPPCHRSSPVQYRTTLSQAGKSPSRRSAATSTFSGESGCGSVRSWWMAVSVDESV